MGLQAVHHGFGITVQADKLVFSEGKALHDAITKVLQNPSYKVSNSSFIFIQACARQAQQAQLGAFWRNQLSPTSSVLC